MYIFSILEHAAACYSLKSWTAFALVFVSSFTLLLDSVSVPSSALLKWQEKDLVWHNNNNNKNKSIYLNTMVNYSMYIADVAVYITNYNI